MLKLIKTHIDNDTDEDNNAQDRMGTLRQLRGLFEMKNRNMERNSNQCKILNVNVTELQL